MAKTTRRQPAKANRSDFDLLAEIAGNLWWSWNPRATALLASVYPPAYAASDQNPVTALRKLPARRRRQLAADADFSREVRAVHAELRKYLRSQPWYAQKHGKSARGVTAYFCMEYAVHESLPLYAGGLGVLAGDHLKSASDLGLPFVAIGIYWKKGYTRQRIDKHGRQTDRFPTLAPRDTPLVELKGKSGRPLRLTVVMGKDKVKARAWRMDVGRVPLYLLDTDIPENKARDRRLTHVLYSGDRDTRIRQEILLGIGGWQLLRALGTKVACCHLNEGHAAFLSLERIAERMTQKRESLGAATRYVTNTSVFTTHTPVPAGNEEFDPALVDRYFAAWPKRVGLTREEFHDLARVKAGNAEENFGMTPLALRTSKYANGVAALHGKIAREMWKPLWPGRPVTKVPIGHVTNGVHTLTWMHPRMVELLDEFLGDDWADAQDQAATWAHCKYIPDDVLWDLHQQFKEELIAFCRKRVRAQITRSKLTGMKPADADRILDPDALTIGFARRFAPYKRATLCFRDAARLAKILNDRHRPVQIIFAGKAHPADAGGKAIIEELMRQARAPRFRRRIVFLEDYEMDVARHMVAGVDVWLNNPERPREASGTSGMKPALHGGLNLSILDGWWPEGCNGRNGWAIGKGRDHDGTKAADDRDAADLYRLLEKEVVPAYYSRDRHGLPGAWLARMKNALMTIPPVFNTHRQVKEYLAKYYAPAMRNA
ncbi:MAG TPA: alpha-glucan family phosphorylase [Phycisphaerae bacterium]|nr:alpha-glucan family phosphorylase [Phycisphaerales bacterium]HRX84539.1 alpha-glucan family phosphorylase [Phycisphaerae bacterium]